MSRLLAKIVAIAVLGATPFAQSNDFAARASPGVASQPFGVRESVALRVPLLQNGNDVLASPDGRRFAVVFQGGNPDTNELIATVLIGDAGPRSANPRIIAQFERVAKDSNLDAVRNIRWSGDSRAITFLSQDMSKTSQVFSYDIETGKLEQLTRGPRDVVSYSVSRDLSTTLFTTALPREMLWTPQTRQDGLVVKDDALEDLVAGRSLGRGADDSEVAELYLQRKAWSQPRALTLKGAVSLEHGPEISPDGMLALVASFEKTIPEQWSTYGDATARLRTEKNRNARGDAGVATYKLVDLRTGAETQLLNSPQFYPASAVWSPDSNEVFISSTFLPLNNRLVNNSDLLSKRFAVTVGVNGRVAIVGEGDPLTPSTVRWMTSVNHPILVRRSGDQETSLIRRGNIWRAGKVRHIDASTVFIRQDLNEPPKLTFRGGDGKDAVLYDPNPEIQRLRLGRVEEVTWRSLSGTLVQGALYYPTDYVPGKRYPLVMQTHGYSAKAFEPSGSATTAFAAQALANRGIMVLQGWEFPPDRMAEGWASIMKNGWTSPEHMRFERDIYYGAIDELDRRGLVDRSRVGVIGFSYTCWLVKYMLTHSDADHHFAAAAIAEGFDGSYMSYLVLTSQPHLAEQFEQYYGSAPIGAGLRNWTAQAPAFQSERVTSPLLIEVLNPSDALLEWEWFALLRRRGAPVEMMMVEDGSHLLRKPWDRVAVAGANVDWFDYWLNGDTASEVAEGRAERWRLMRR